MSTRILGISCDYHDAAAALVVDGIVVAAVEEERLSRSKHDNSLPVRAIESCLAIGSCGADELDAVVFHEKPMLVAQRVLTARQRRGPAALMKFATEFPVLLRRNLLIAQRVEVLLREMGAASPPPLRYAEHHLSHASAAFLPSPFDTAAILTVDGIGEWSSATLGHGLHHRVDLVEEQRYPHSLGLLYSLATVWCGFEANDGEYKLMGLAPFGEPSYRDQLAQLVEVHEDGSIAVDTKAVRWWGTGPDRMQKVTSLLGPARRKGEPLTKHHADLARSVQELTETAVLRMAAHARRVTGESRICLSGGVALNCVANGRLLREGDFEDIWVQPASGDAGSAIGAALWYWHDELDNRRAISAEGECDPLLSDGMSAGALGPAFGDHEIDAWISARSVESTRLADSGELCREVARRIDEGAIIGWFQGRMEFGPRALGHRSILADPRSPTVQREINLRVKGREGFRPFAPAVLWEHANDWFEIDRPSPYMLFTHPVAAHRRLEVDVLPEDIFQSVQVPRSQIPACTHVDGSARVQTVHQGRNGIFHDLLSAFYELTGCPILLNTSFNRAGEPIVCTPDDALDCAHDSGIDVLVIGHHLVEIDRRGIETGAVTP